MISLEYVAQSHTVNAVDWTKGYIKVAFDVATESGMSGGPMINTQVVNDGSSLL